MCSPINFGEFDAILTTIQFENTSTTPENPFAICGHSRPGNQ